MNLQHALIALALTASGSAQAFSCAPTGTQECRLELSTVTIVFDSGVLNFDGDSQFNGTDGYVVGYTIGSGQFPNLDTVDTGGGRRAGFSFNPGMYGQVGGSGFEGSHEAFASFGFTGLQFIAKPGFKVDEVEFTVTGGFTQVGNGHVALQVQGPLQITGDLFSAQSLYAPGTGDYAAWLSASAHYEEGDDGGANAYGTASAFFDSASIVARVSPVPLPGAVLSMLSGLGTLAIVTSRRAGKA